MSKMRCTCGHLIIDQTDDLPYKGEFIGDRDWERVWSAISHDMEELLGTNGAEERLRWMRKRFGAMYPTDLPLSSIITDAITGHRLASARDIYECQGCGTLWLQTSPSSRQFQGYSPQEGNARGILDTGGVSGRTG